MNQKVLNLFRFSASDADLQKAIQMSTDPDLQRALELSRQTNHMDVDAGIAEIPGLSAVRKKISSAS